MWGGLVTARQKSNMIEVEKNFDLRPGDKERLINNAKLLYRKTFTDVYYDNKNYYLTGMDYWLRERNGKFEFKVPLNTGLIKRRVTDQYRELETEDEIAHELKLNTKGGFGKCLLCENKRGNLLAVGRAFLPTASVSISPNNSWTLTTAKSGWSRRGKAKAVRFWWSFWVP